MNLIRLTIAAEDREDSVTVQGATLDVLLLNPRYVVSVIGTSTDPDADTGSRVTLANGKALTVVESVREVEARANRHD